MDRTCTCQRPHCNKKIPAPTGDGSSIRRSDGLQPHFFCSDTCANAWEANTRECIISGCTNRVVEGEGCSCPLHTEEAAEAILGFEAGIPADVE